MDEDIVVIETTHHRQTCSTIGIDDQSISAKAADVAAVDIVKSLGEFVIDLFLELLDAWLVKELVEGDDPGAVFITSMRLRWFLDKDWPG